jgi:hypothetical protein
MMSAVDGSLMIFYMRYGSVSLLPASQPRAGPHTCRPFMITRSLSSLIDFDVQRPTSNLQDLVHDPDTVLILTLIHRTTDHGPRTHDTAVQRTHERTTRARNRTWRGAGRRDRRATRIANAPQENINSPQRRERPRPSRPARRPGCAGTANASRQSSHHTRQTGAALSRVRPARCRVTLTLRHYCVVTTSQAASLSLRTWRPRRAVGCSPRSPSPYGYALRAPHEHVYARSPLGLHLTSSIAMHVIADTDTVRPDRTRDRTILASRPRLSALCSYSARPDD